jgi:hypothetical protein
MGVQIGLCVCVCVRVPEHVPMLFTGVYMLSIHLCALNTCMPLPFSNLSMCVVTAAIASQHPSMFVSDLSARVCCLCVGS